MQAYKVKGKIDHSGHLIIAEAIEMDPGDVEVIVLQSMTEAALLSKPSLPENGVPQKRVSKIQAFQGLFENAPPISADYDPEQAKWEYLKEKHVL